MGRRRVSGQEDDPVEYDDRPPSIPTHLHNRDIHSLIILLTTGLTTVEYQRRVWITPACREDLPTQVSSRQPLPDLQPLDQDRLRLPIRLLPSVTKPLQNGQPGPEEEEEVDGVEFGVEVLSPD